jgi:hypothetical protein
VVIASLGGVVILWAGAVAWMAARLSVRLALRVVMTANIVAAAAIAAFSTSAASVLVLISILGVAIDVGAFAGSQAIALTRLRPPPTGGVA